ncbi:MAG: hypothetical protein NVSMB7_08610 [Chitinophagaceae bacterium]
MIFYVADKKADRTGMVPMQCLQVKEKPGEPYALFYSGIDGFKYEQGYTYELEVMRTKKHNPAADAPAYQYYLISVIKKENVKSAKEKTPAIPNQVIMPLSRINRNGNPVNAGNDGVPDIYFDLNSGKVSGNNSCNRYSATTKMGNGSISIGTISSTRMACMNNETEELFMKYLSAVNRYVMKGSTLQLLKDKEVLLQFYVPLR